MERRRGLVYGRRKGPKPSARQALLRQTLLPELTLRPEQGRDPRAYFSSPPEEVWLEVGYGGGEHLLWQAEHHSHIGLIGAEPYEGGTAKLLSRIDSLSPGSLSQRRKGSNVRVYEGDAREIIDALPDAGLGRVFILFPDPWPKTRHHKRRFIQTDLLDDLARVMRPGAELRFATDDGSYLVWALERLLAHPMFEWTADRAADWTTRPADWPATRYETKAIKGPPTYLRFLRSARL